MNDGERGAVMERTTRVFRDIFDDDDLELTDATTAADIEEWDSLMHVTLMVALEKEFGVRLKVAEIGSLPNVGAMVDLLWSKVGG